ncbi:MAG: hypothetical protein ACHQ16_08595 [Candidatus Lutacidiplasmatales archaeon]|jgi:hypothetical protein
MTEETREQYEARLLDGVLQGVVARETMAVRDLINRYYDDDPIATGIGLATAEAQLRPSFPDGPTGPTIRIEYGRKDEHDFSIDVDNPLHTIINESETPDA